MGGEIIPGPLDVKYRNIQFSGGRNLRVQLTQRAGGGIARICEQSLSPAFALLIQSVEDLFRHVYLSADDEPGRSVGDFQRNGPDRAQIFGDILPHLAVSPSGSPNKNSVFIFQGNRQSIHLGLYHIFRLGNHPLDPLVEGLQLLKVEHILERFQRHLMPHLGEGFQRLSSHPLGGGIRGNCLRVGRLQLLQTAQLVVVVIVRHSGLVQHVVLVARLGQFLAECLNFGKIIHGNTLLWADIEIFG